MFTLKEAALAHALAAERLLGGDATFLNENEAMIPVFVNLLFQSIEMTLKSIAIESGLATDHELRDKKNHEKWSWNQRNCGTDKLQNQ